jgi:hypothetical protein
MVDQISILPRVPVFSMGCFLMGGAVSYSCIQYLYSIMSGGSLSTGSSVSSRTLVTGNHTEHNTQ